MAGGEPMSELVADCPRCGANKITFDLDAAIIVGLRHSWQQVYEAYCVCRRCKRSVIFLLSDHGIDENGVIKKSGGLVKLSAAANRCVEVERYLSLRDEAPVAPPEHVPDEIAAVFTEGATCLAVECYNAAATMFRLCVDLATAGLLPEADEDGLTKDIRRTLGRRLKWLFDHARLPESYRELSTCIKEDGNDGAHAGTLKKADAQDLLDFTTALLERRYTEPKRVELAKARRTERRKPAR
jgi:hypothetical protein